MTKEQEDYYTTKRDSIRFYHKQEEQSVKILVCTLLEEDPEPLENLVDLIDKVKFAKRRRVKEHAELIIWANRNKIPLTECGFADANYDPDSES